MRSPSPKDAEALYARAEACWHGSKKKRSLARYCHWVRLAARAGHPDAQWELGTHYQDGLNDHRGMVLLRKNRRLAAKWYSAAAEAGHDAAMNNLGVMLDNGDGIRRDSARALELYKRCLRTDPGGAANNIATWYRDRRDDPAAARWWRKSIAAGHDEALVDLGYACLYGVGARRDPEAAAELFRKAVRSSCISEYWHEEALYLLGCLHAEGNGVRRSPKRAAALFERASADGDYPIAEQALSSLRASSTPTFCRCRRNRVGRLPGNAPCPRHGTGPKN